MDSRNSWFRPEGVGRANMGFFIARRVSTLPVAVVLHDCAHIKSAACRQALGDVDIDRKPRSGKEMAEEAARFRQLMTASARMP